MKKILSVICGNVETGGVEKYLLNAYENIDHKGLKIDIFIPGKIVYEPYADSYRQLGCNLLIMNNVPKPQLSKLWYLRLFCDLRKVLAQKRYDLIHINTGNLTIQTIALYLAKKHKIGVRVAHSHGTLYTGGKIKEIVKGWMRKSVNRNATKKLACSYAAAYSLFGKDESNSVIIAKNGIDIQRYKYDESIRKRIRKENGWDGKYVIGSVGRLSPEKNYEFVLKVFSKLIKKYPDSLLVIAGDGGEKHKLERLAKILKIDDKVKLIGVRDDVPELMQGFDVFTLASKREAFPIVSIEAQTTGLPCVVSDAVPKEVNVTGGVSFISLTENTSKWIKTIMNKITHFNRIDRSIEITRLGYDMSKAYLIINDLYHMR